VIRAKNRAELSGLAARVQAFDGDGGALAQNLMVTKLAPGFRSILSNSEGPLMELFGQFTRPASSGDDPHRGSPGLAADSVGPLRPAPRNENAGHLPADPFTSNPARTEAQP
jgi:hypothetical protein